MKRMFLCVPAACMLCLFCLLVTGKGLSTLKLPVHKGILTHNFKSSRTSIPPVRKTIKLTTGVKLEYVEQGDLKGIPVILLHGFPDSWKSFEKVMAVLPDRFHVFSISQRGFGESEKPQTGYHPRDFAADLNAFVTALNLEPAVIVGHSMGSTIVQQFALKYPEQVKALVMAGAFATFRDKPDMKDFSSAIDNFNEAPDSVFIKEFQQGTLAQPVPPLFFNVLIRQSLKIPLHVWKRVLKELVTTDYISHLHEIKKPALIAWGTLDNLCPRKDQVAITNAIEGSKLIQYEGAGHSFHWEKPERFAKDLIAFIDSITG